MLRGASGKRSELFETKIRFLSLFVPGSALGLRVICLFMIKNEKNYNSKGSLSRLRHQKHKEYSKYLLIDQSIRDFIFSQIEVIFHVNLYELLLCFCVSLKC